jgi:uncharacterized protein YajQ (UPF0234 family)
MQIKIHINGSEEMTLVSSDKLEVQSLLKVLSEHLKDEVKINANLLDHDNIKSWRLFSNTKEYQCF